MVKKRTPDFAKDFYDFLSSLLKAKCQFVVVGAHAMGAWGYVRATGDLDILVIPSPVNSKRVFQALKDFGAPLKNVRSDDFAIEGTVYQMGLPPLRIDLLTKIDGITSLEVFSKAKKMQIAGVKVRVISFQHLLKNKKTAAREKDILDLKELAAIKEIKNAKKKKR